MNDEPASAAGPRRATPLSAGARLRTSGYLAASGDDGVASRPLSRPAGRVVRRHAPHTSKHEAEAGQKSAAKSNLSMYKLDMGAQEACSLLR